MGKIIKGTDSGQEGIGKLRTGRGKPWRLTIGIKFISLVVLVALLAGGIVGLVTLKSSRAFLREQVLHNNLDQANLAADFVSNYMKTTQKPLEILAARADIGEAVLNNQPEKLQATLAEFVQTQTTLLACAIFDAAGIQRVSGHANSEGLGKSFTDREWFKQVVTTGQPFLSKPIMALGNVNTIGPYAIPILDDQGKVRAVMTGSISLAILSDEIVNINYGTDSRATLIDTRYGGTIVADRDPQLIIKPVTGEDIFISRLLAGESGMIETSGSGGETDLVGFAPVPDLPWSIMIATTSASALAIVKSLSYYATLFTVVFTLLAAIIGIILVLGITRPVRRLVEGTQEISRGNLDFKVAIKSKDEIGDLSDAFNNMTVTLKDTLHNLYSSEENFRNSMDNSPLGIRIAGKDSELLYANRTLLDIYGYGSLEELGSIPAKNRYTPQSYAEYQIRKDRQRHNGPAPDSYEISIVRKDGTVRHLRTFPKEVLWGGKPQYMAFYLDITERKQMEQALLTSEENFRNSMDNSPLGIRIVSKDGDILYANRSVNEMFGYENLEELKKGMIINRYTPQSFSEFQIRREKRLKGEPVPDNYEISIVRKDGAVRHLQVFRKEVLWGGKPQYQVLYQDITERKQAEEAAKSIQNDYLLLIDNLHAGVVVHTKDTNIVFANQQASILLGLRIDQMIGKTGIDAVWSFLNEDETPMRREDYPVNLVLNTRQPMRDKVLGINRRLNDRVWVLVNSFPSFDACGEIQQIVVTFIDITERKQAEEKVKKSELLLVSSLESQKDTLLFSIDRNYRYLYFNKAHLDVMKWAYNQDIAIGMNILECITSDDDRKVAKENYDRALSGESHSNIREYGDVNKAYYESFFNPIEQDGIIIGATGLARNISERMQLEAALKNSEGKYRSLFNNMANGFALHRIVTNKKGEPSDFIFLEVNEAFQRLTGLKAEKIIGKKVTEALRGVEKDTANWIPLYGKVATTGQEIKFEQFSQALNKWFSVTAYSPKKEYFATVIEDVTERKQAETKLVEMEALKKINQAKSELLANVSHELRTPLASIKGFIETLIETDVKWSKKQQMEFLQAANQETDRLTLLIKDLLDMSRLDSGKLVLDKRSYKVSEIMESVSGVLSIIAAKHKLKVFIAPGLPPLRADKIRIGQVITNLVENATKFSPEGSQIELEVIFMTGSVILSVQDQGIGMPQEVQDNLFNRFYQASQVVTGKSRGSGLGLAICKGIVEGHGGRIWVESQEGKGSRFSFSLTLSTTENNGKIIQNSGGQL